MDKQDDTAGMEDMPGRQGSGGEGEGFTGAGVPEVEKKRRKVSLIGAIVVNVVTLIILAIVLLAILLPGYRRSFTVARAVKGAEEVWIVVHTSEARMRENSTDFLRAQDGLQNTLQEEMDGGGNVWAYVRDNYPDQGWVKDNLPESMRVWLEELFPAPEVTEEDMPGEVLQDMIDMLDEERQAGEEQQGEEQRP